MTKPRSQQVCLEATPYYHCVSRCVCKAYLCGVDFFTKQSYEHRRAWLEQEILKTTNKTPMLRRKPDEVQSFFV